MLLKKPYFMTNKDWYYHDKAKNRLFLTDKAPEKAKQSYKEFYAQLNKPDPSLYADIMNMAEQRKRQKLKEQGKTPEEIEQIIAEWLKGE